MARKRLSPPSTGSTYTTSAAESPACGRARTILSIFTAITGPRLATGSPVNGDTSRGGGAAGADLLPAGPERRIRHSPMTRPPTALPAQAPPGYGHDPHPAARRHPDQPRLRAQAAARRVVLLSGRRPEQHGELAAGDRRDAGHGHPDLRTRRTTAVPPGLGDRREAGRRLRRPADRHRPGRRPGHGAAAGRGARLGRPPGRAGLAAGGPGPRGPGPPGGGGPGRWGPGRSPAGSMGPRVDAVCRFVEKPGVRPRSAGSTTRPPCWLAPPAPSSFRNECEESDERSRDRDR